MRCERRRMTAVPAAYMAKVSDFVESYAANARSGSPAITSSQMEARSPAPWRKINYGLAAFIATPRVS